MFFHFRQRAFLSKVDHDAVAAAIAGAEKATSGQIRVFVTHRRAPDPLAAARNRFDKLGMAATRRRNAILLFVAPASRTFAVIGDTGIHEKCGSAEWEAISARIGRDFAAGNFTEGLRAAVADAGALLAGHFPPEEGGGNELPDAVEED